MSRERFSELLPWYVNGTLSAEDRAWVDGYLSEHPTAREELDWYRSLQEGIADSAPKVPATIGLAKTMSLIRGDRPKGEVSADVRQAVASRLGLL